jgi:MFS family permease
MMLLIIIGTISIGAVFAITNMVLIPYLVSEFGSTIIPSRLVSVGMMSAVALSVVIGILIDKYKRILPFILGITITACVAVLFLSTDVLMLIYIGAILIVAAAFSFLTPISSLIASHSAPQNYDKNYGYLMGTVNGSVFFISLLMGKLSTWNMTGMFELMSVIIFCPMVPLIIYGVIRKNKQPVTVDAASQPKNENSSVLSIFKNYPIVNYFFIMQFGFWFAIGGLFPYFTYFLSTETNLSLEQAIVWFGIITLLSSIIAFITGIVTKIFKPKYLLLCSLCAVMILAFITFFFYGTVVKGNGTFLFSKIAFILGSISLAFYYTLSTAQVSKIVLPRDIGKTYGINSVVFIGSQAISIRVVGDLLDKYGFQSMFLVIGISFVVALFGMIGMTTHKAYVESVL